MKVKVRHGIYIEEEHAMKRVRLSEKEYAMASGAMISVCADTVVIDPRKRLFYLARRAVKPMQGYWNIGGRRFPGETISEAAARNFNRETGLHIAPHRFQLVGAIEAIWKDRKEKPRNAGKHDIIHVSALALTAKERAFAAAHLDPNEYIPNSLEAFDRAKMVATKVHPALIALHDKVFPK